MYSVVLMMAVAGGADVPAGHFGHGGCYGSCTGTTYASCSGGGCHGSTVVYSSGCCGGYSCHGGNSCHGGGHKSHSCGGGFFGGHKHKSHGCCGGASYSCHGGYGCCGGTVIYGCCGGGCIGTVVVPAEKKEMKKEEKKEEKKTTETPKEVRASAPATIVVTLPADAKLTIDGAATVSTTARRVFVSPELPAGREFVYTLQAEIVKDGKPVVTTRDVTVRAGAEVAVTLEAGLTGVASR